MTSPPLPQAALPLPEGKANKLLVSKNQDYIEDSQHSSSSDNLTLVKARQNNKKEFNIMATPFKYFGRSLSYSPKRSSTSCSTNSAPTDCTNTNKILRRPREKQVTDRTSVLLDSDSCRLLKQVQFTSPSDVVTHYIDHVRTEDEEDQYWYKMNELQSKRRNELKSNLRAQLYSKEPLNLEASQTMTWRGLEDVLYKTKSRKEKATEHVQRVLEMQSTLQRKRNRQKEQMPSKLRHYSERLSLGDVEYALKLAQGDEQIALGKATAVTPAMRPQSSSCQTTPPKGRGRRRYRLEALANSLTRSFSSFSSSKPAHCPRRHYYRHRDSPQLPELGTS